MRVRKRSRSPEEYMPGSTRPITPRTPVVSTFARESRQLVSRMPASGVSRAMANPMSSQNSRTIGQTCAGSAFATIQRWSPPRSMRALGTDGRTPEAADGVPCGEPTRSRLYCEKLVVARGSGMA
jgi:hypothetical protein